MDELAAVASDAHKLSPALGITLREAYAAMRRLMEPGVRYDVGLDNVDGQILKRFSRALPVEAWIVAMPIDDDGKPRRDKDCVVSAIVVDLKTVRAAAGVGSKSVEAMLVAELEALKAENA